jgi:hypothetical protein
MEAVFVFFFFGLFWGCSLTRESDRLLRTEEVVAEVERS